MFVSVRYNGEYIRSIDNVLLNGKVSADRDYQIKLTGYGEYYIRYIAYDQCGEEQSECKCCKLFHLVILGNRKVQVVELQ